MKETGQIVSAMGEPEDFEGLELDGLGLEGSLTLKQTRFVQEYIATGNAKQSAITAGYSVTSATEIGYETLRIPHVRRAVADRLRAAAIAAGVTAAAVVAELYDIATADPTEHCRTVVDCCRHCYGIEHRCQWTPGEYRRAFEKALSEGKPAPEIQGGLSFNPNLPPVESCSECFGRGTVTVIHTPSAKVSPAARRLLASVKQSKDGSVEIKMHDQLKALELLGRYAGAFKDIRELSGPGGGPVALTAAYQPGQARQLSNEQLEALVAQIAESRGIGGGSSQVIEGNPDEAPSSESLKLLSHGGTI
jgi:phage terminase small subunit